MIKRKLNFIVPFFLLIIFFSCKKDSANINAKIKSNINFKPDWVDKVGANTFNIKNNIYKL